MFIVKIYGLKALCVSRDNPRKAYECHLKHLKMIPTTFLGDYLQKFKDKLKPDLVAQLRSSYPEEIPISSDNLIEFDDETDD